jgi:hypothetical protein
MGRLVEVARSIHINSTVVFLFLILISVPSCRDRRFVLLLDSEPGEKRHNRGAPPQGRRQCDRKRNRPPDRSHRLRLRIRDHHSIRQNGRNFFVARNAIIGHIIHSATDQVDWSGLPRSLATGGYFRVVCPNPTAVTSSIEPQCRRQIGSLMQLTHTYEVIGVLELSELNSTDLFVILRIGTVVPRTFIDVPKMYFALWKKSNADSLVMGRGIPIGAGPIVLVIHNRQVTVIM